MNKCICIHGHFYQPPRENAWLEVIEMQDSAYPYHDWNERINFECYGPNRASRILNENDQIIDIVNNYSQISFNFGPTLLQWMERYAFNDYQSLLEGDRKSIQRFGGHGSAMAQVYNHIIMPLANRRDKETQVKWGIADFKLRFNRDPEGMWLAETAVDTETLEVLAENGILFTILAPRQAAKVKKIGTNDWTVVDEGSLDTRNPYLCKLPSGKQIALFFYNGSVSQDIAFKGLLISGKDFANRLISSFGQHEGPQLVHVATDGESYGHHHLHGDMALAYCLDYIQKNNLAKITNYGQYLELYPPQWEVQIHENSSWSCVHGVERWRANCGCNSGMNHGWHQLWRAPLRETLDWLRDQLAVVFEKEMSRFTKQPWEARNAYIHVVLNRNKEAEDAFLNQYFSGFNQTEAITKILRMLEMQRHSLLMFTSCGWFFDELSGIETTQIMQYAARAIQLAESESSLALEGEFQKRLKETPSNLDKYKNGLNIYKECVLPSKLTLSKVGSHYAVASLFDEFPEVITICNYRAESEQYERLESGSFRLAIGKTRVHSIITRSLRTFYFAVIYLGQHHIIGNSRSFMEDADYESMRQQIKEAFANGSIADVMGIMQTFFGPEKFSLWSLFKDEQRKVLGLIVKKDLDFAYQSYKTIYERNVNLVKLLSNTGLPVPTLLRKNLETVINEEIRNFFENGTVYPAKLEKWIEDALQWELELDEQRIAYSAEQKLFYLIKQVQTASVDYKALDQLIRIIKGLKSLQIDLDLWEFENEYFRIGRELNSMLAEESLKQNDALNIFIQYFETLGNLIKVFLPIYRKTAV